MVCEFDIAACKIGKDSQHQLLQQWAPYQIRNIANCACTWNTGNVFPATAVSDPDIHHGTCVTHVPRCMPGPLTNGGAGVENVPGIAGSAQPPMSGIWWEVYADYLFAKDKTTLIVHLPYPSLMLLKFCMEAFVLWKVWFQKESVVIVKYIYFQSAASNIFELAVSCGGNICANGLLCTT